MKSGFWFLSFVAAFGLAAIAHAAERIDRIGGDLYVSGSSPSISADASRDVFVAGFSPSGNADVAGDMHIAGFDVDVGGNIGQDLYAAGASVTVTASVRDDITISGFTVHLAEGGSVGGNARLGAGTVILDAPIAGSLVVAAGEIKLNAPITGNVRISAGDISFGPKAQILGKLDYFAPQEMAIPASVIPADRVRFSSFHGSRFAGDVKGAIDESMTQMWPSYWVMALGFLVGIVYLLILAALLLAFAPDVVERLRTRIERHLGKALLSGFIGLAMLVGMIPVSAITIVGIPLIPLLLLLIVVAWKLGYLLGVYALVMRVADAFDRTPKSLAGKLAILAIGLFLFSLLNFIPVLGWLFNLMIVLIGLGAVTAILSGRLLSSATSGDDASVQNS